jgi:predicted Na+-dependent transporter
LKPEFTIDVAAVRLLFVLSGLALPLRSLPATLSAWRCHALVQTFNLAAMPLAAAAVAKGLVRRGVLDQSTGDGFVVAMAVPTTSNMCVALTTAADGDSVAAVLNAVAGNLMGVLATPLLLSKLLSSSSLSSSSSSSSSSLSSSSLSTVTAVAGGGGAGLALAPILARLLRKVHFGLVVFADFFF